ncbi:MAG: RNA-binding S4 domain-containing protein [Acidimicrobiia bacterium]|nr:RNA-binding S4 domain-containing protein [Acidimicrobiia bacterium]
MREIPITTDEIRLGQLLKLAGIVEQGSDARILLADGDVTVNGEQETRRGRRLRPGDEVMVEGQSIRVV